MARPKQSVPTYRHHKPTNTARCWVGGRWVSLPPVEHRLTAALLDRYRAVVSRESLARAGWPEGIPGRNVLDVHIVRLRRRLAPLGLAIRTVRSRGYLLEEGAALPEAR